MTETAIGPMRACTKCGVEKPHTAECFHVYPRKGQSGRLAGFCRECWRAHEREYQRKRYAEKGAVIAAKMRAYRAANPDKAAAWEAKRPDRSEYNRERKARLQSEMTEDERRAKNEKVKAWKRANPDKVREHWERTYAKHREKHFARQRRWAQENPTAAAANRDRRRAKEFGAEGVYTKDDVRDLLATQGRFCRYCQSPLKKFHVDHFIPLARGGSNWPSNLVLSCPSCNYSKGGKMPWVWRPDLFSPPSE